MFAPARRRVFQALTVFVMLAGAGCRSHDRSDCLRICSREAECAEAAQIEHDRRECVDACALLDRDPATRPQVERHALCVDGAASCRAVLACD